MALNANNDEVLWTADQVARQLRITEWKVYDLVRRGILTPGVYIKLGRSIRFSPSQFAEWKANGGKAFKHGWRKESAA